MVGLVKLGDNVLNVPSSFQRGSFKAPLLVSSLDYSNVTFMVGGWS